MSNLQTRLQPPIPIEEYVRRTFVPLSRLAHGWELHSALLLTPTEERTMVREPSTAVPDSIARRIGKLRVLVIPFVECSPSGDLVAWSKPQGDTHSAVWIEGAERVDLILPCRELDAHDTGFEFLASVAELLRIKLNDGELEKYTQLLTDELRFDISGEIDDDARAAKKAVPARKSSSQERRPTDAYRDVSFVSTASEYMHGLWHDVQIHVGAEHLPVKYLRRRMELLADMFPPNRGYNVFSRELQDEQLPE